MNEEAGHAISDHRRRRALGGYYGGALVKGGADVTFLVRPRRATQLAEQGLTIRTKDDAFTTLVKTAEAGAVGGLYDVVFLACKAYDLDGAIDDFATALSPDGAVLPVLNGINHIAVLSERLGSPRVLGGVTLFSVVLTPEGDISVPGIGPTGRTSIGELTGQRSARCDEICAALSPVAFRLRSVTISSPKCGRNFAALRAARRSRC